VKEKPQYASNILSRFPNPQQSSSEQTPADEEQQRNKQKMGKNETETKHPYFCFLRQTTKQDRKKKINHTSLWMPDEEKSSILE